ncbi:hypothetical protein, partial [Flavobacterium sp. MFBS3-15]|uniref:hypothetical protein n=1 Tax=Flavobacterium sp. MFBS3-15 TaxID=2989816 RepID=UPI0022362385
MKRKFIFGLLCLLSQLAQAQNEPNDCVNAITVCGNGDFASNADGIGNVQEVFGCSSSENNSIWLKINIVQGGTLGFELTPDNQDIMVDYDFWVYGPNVQCGALGNPIRCNTTNPWAAGSPDNHTGMDGNSIVTQSGPGPDGNGYVKWLTVSPGQSYYIVIDRPEGDGGFQIEWTGTATTGSGAFSEPPAANNLGEVRTCSTTPNVAVFDLQSLKSQVNPDLSGNTVNFYASYANAFDGSMPLGDSYSNTSNPQQLFAKVTNTATGCFSIVDLTLRVYPVPTVTVAASATSVCSGSNVTVTFSGTPNAFFNYTVNGGASQQQQLNASGTFTLTQNITANTVYAVSGAFVTSADNVVVCSQVLNNSVTVNVVAPQSVSAQTNSPVCIGEDGVITLTGPSGATVNYTVNGAAQPQATLNGAGSGTITLEALTENTPFEIVSVTSANAPFCTTQLNITGTIITNSSPELNTPAPMNGCGDGGPALFDLESYNDVITDGNPNYVVTYYLSLENANLGEEPLDSPYQAVSMNQTVYVRVQSAGSASCVAFTTLDLITATPPSVNAPAAPLETCDDDYDGLATFDLTALIDEITGNNPNLSVTFHELVTQAETGTPFIENPAAYTSTVAGTQTVHVRVVDPANSECYALTTVTLVVLERPAVAQVSPYALCDDNNSPDGVEIFDLTTRDNEVTGGVAGTTVAYYASQEDLDNNIAIANPANFENTTQWEQQIWAKATSANGCESSMPVTLTVNPLPVVNPDMGTFYACEEVPGQGEFDLTEIAQGVTGGVQNYAVAFYPDFDTAQTGGNTLPAEYLAPSGTIYALLTDTGTNCRVITPVTLEVLPAPIATQPAPIEECGQDNTAVFNLDPVLDQIEAELGNTVTATAHETYNDAFYGGANPVANTGAYSNVYALTTNGVQTLYILVQSDQTECSDIVELQLIVNPRPIATEPEAYALCDNGSNDTDGIAVFDLTTLEAEILGTLNPAQFAVSFYDADGLIPTPASYPSASQVITGRVTNTATGCYDEVDVELIVNPLPQAAPPAPYTLCDLNNPGDEVEEFDLNTKIDEIIGTQDGLLVTFFKDYDEAVAGTGASQILTPESYFNASAVEAIFVRVTVEETGCFRIVLLDVRVEPVPVL